MRKVLILMAFMALMTGNLNAQVFVTEKTHSDIRVQTEESSLAAQLPEQHDRFAPIGGGTLILATLGGAYLWSRKKQKTDK